MPATFTRSATAAPGATWPFTAPVPTTIRKAASTRTTREISPSCSPAAAGRSSYYVIASCATVTIFMAQLALNVFGSLDLLPFTGVTFPFVSKGGSSLISCWGMLAYIKAGDTRSGGSFALRTSFENARRGKKKKEAVK